MPKFDQYHTIKGLPPMPGAHSEKAAILRRVLHDLAGMLEGGGGIMYKIDKAEEAAANNPRKKYRDLMEVNHERATPAALNDLAARLTLANIAKDEPGTIDPDTALGFISAARSLYEDEGSIEIDELDRLHAPTQVSSADPKKGAYVQAWVWVPGVDEDE